MKADLHSYIMHSDTHKGHAEKPYKQHEHVKKYEKHHNRLFFRRGRRSLAGIKNVTTSFCLLQNISQSFQPVSLKNQVCYHWCKSI